MKSVYALKIAKAVSVLALLNTVAIAGGMPAAQRDTIHGLFDSHKMFVREITETEQGYISKTTSEDPAAVKLLQTHVKQMEKRLKDGMMVRGWDPAYVEFVNHYDDIDIKITNIENGISIIAMGKTSEAREVARNHAGIISKFINHGWSEHDKTHAAVFSDSSETEGKGGMGKMSCCQMGDKQSATTGKECGAGKESGCAIESKSERETGVSCCQNRG